MHTCICFHIFWLYPPDWISRNAKSRKGSYINITRSFYTEQLHCVPRWKSLHFLHRLCNHSSVTFQLFLLQNTHVMVRFDLWLPNGRSVRWIIAAHPPHCGCDSWRWMGWEASMSVIKPPSFLSCHVAEYVQNNPWKYENTQVKPIVLTPTTLYP